MADAGIYIKTEEGLLPGATVPGAKGDKGDTGTPGEKWFSQEGVPSNATGAVGDWSINSINGDVYEKTGATTWTLKTNMRGPIGPQGVQGIQGIQGPTGSVASVNGDVGPAVVITKSTVGLSNVDNTSDANKPVSTATQTALNAKVSTTGDENISGKKTFTSSPRFDSGSGSVSLGPGTADHTYLQFFARTATPLVRTAYIGFGAAAVNTLTIANELSGGAITLNTTGGGAVMINGQHVVVQSDPKLTDARTPTGAAGGDLAGTYPNPTIGASKITDTHIATANKDGVAGTASMRTLGTGATQAAAGNHAHTKADVGLGNVDNTSDANKPVSTATQTALNAKVSTTGNETIAGTKTFSSEIVGPALGNVLKVGDDARLVDVNLAHVMGIVSQTDTTKGGVQFGATTGNFRIEGSGTAGTVTGSLAVSGLITSGGQAVVLTNDARMTNARTPVAHVHGSADITSGRLGLNGLSGIADWNLAVNPGWYSADSATNSPITGWVMGEVVTHDPNPGNLYVTQTVWSLGASGTDTNAWRRQCIAGGWQAWYRIRLSETELDARYAKTTSGIINETALPLRLRAAAQNATALGGNLNNLDFNGWAVANGLETTNLPFATDTWAMVQYIGDSSNGRQTAYYWNSDDSVYERDQRTGAWSAWRRIRVSEAAQDARYAALAHTHTTANVIGLDSALTGKVGTTGNETISGTKTFAASIGFSNVSTGINFNGGSLVGSGSGYMHFSENLLISRTLAVGSNFVGSQGANLFVGPNSNSVVADRGLVVRGMAAQTGNLQEWQNSSASILAAIDASGNFTSGGIALVKTNDSRLSDARTPTTHSHTIADLPVATSGTSNATQLVRADDSRLSNARTPTAHNHAASEITSGTLDVARLGAAVIRVVYSGSWPARPTGATYVEWVGPSAPTGAVDGDTWVSTA